MMSRFTAFCRKPPDKPEEEITHDGTCNIKPMSQKNYSRGDASRIPCGLINQGMTCYLNVVLQSLFMTVKYRNQLRSTKKEVTDTYQEENVSKALAEFFKKLNSEQRPIPTIEVTQALNITNVCEQQDAAEYLQMILHKTPEPSKVFRGTLKTFTTCSECNTENGADTEFLSILLSTDDNDVYKALEEYQAVHVMKGDDRLYCVTCKKLNNMTTQNCILEWPAILTLQLKRFETAFFGKGGIYYRKNENKVKIPESIQIYSQYELYVIINHHGTYSGGHYDVFIKDEHGNWFFFNDHRVEKCNETSSELINDSCRSAYLLLYRREDPHEQTCGPQDHTNEGKRSDDTRKRTVHKMLADTENRPSQGLKHGYRSKIHEGENIQTVLTKGDAGFGKTVCVQKFVLDWAEEKTHTDINYMFLIPLQKLNIISQNMKKLSFMELLQRCFEIRENLTFWDSEKIMFILDGLNEFKLPLDIEKTKKIVDVNESASVPDLLTNLIKRNLLPKSLIWITSRPGAAGQIPERYVNRVTQLNGFNEGQKEEYFQRSIGDKSTANRVINHIKTSKRIHSMCHIPDYCRILATMSEMMFKTDRAKIPETLTQMYATFLIAQTKMNRDSSHFLGKETIISLGKLAFQLLVHDRYLLRLEDLKKSGISAESITSNSAIIKMIKDFPNKSKSFCFVNHRTQEFMAALYVTEMINRGHNREHTDPLQEFSSLKLNPLYGEQCFTESRLLQDVVDMTLERQMDVFLSFLLGLSLEFSRRILQGILTRRESSSSSIQAITQHIKSMIQISPEKSSRLFDCLIELDETLFVQDIKTKLKYEVRLSPSDWSDRMFLLLNSEEHQDPTMHKTTAESSSRWNYQKSDKMEKQQSEEQNKRHQPCSTRSHSSVSTLYQERLKQRMKEELQYLNEDTLFGKRPLLKDIFIERKMREESISNPADDKEIPISNIFEGEDIQPVLTKGDAGFGKTVCVQKFVLDWAEEKTHTDINYMFLIPLQKLNIISQNMKKLSFMELLQRCFEIRENLTFWDSEKIMFILDGLNEFKLPLDIEKTKKIVDVNESASVPDLLTNLIKRNLLPKSLIWITSRPGAAGQIPERYVNRVTQLNGFNEGQKEEYFQRSIGDKSTANRVINHIKTSKRIHSMCHIPDYCRILATMSEMMFKTDRAKIPETLTQMYATFLIAQTKMNRDSSHFLGKETIISLGKLAFQLLVHDRYLLRLEDLKKSGISAESITSNSAIIKMIKDFPNKSKSFCFVNHRTQEFMAALYVTEMINRGHNREHTDPLQEFSSLKLNPLYGEQCFTESRLLQDVVDMTLERQMDVFLSFLLGLSLEFSRRILQGILTRRESSSSSIQAITQHIKSMIQISPEKSSRLFDCLIELDETLFVQDIKTKLKYEVRLSPSDWSDRMFLLLNSEEHQDPTMHKTTAESSSRWNYQKSDKMEKQQSEEQNKRHQPCSTRSHSSVSTLYQERLKQRMKEELQYLNEDTLFGKRPLLKDIFIERKMREESISNPADDKEIPISNIFEGENIQPVLTKGDAGFGKTVCVQKFVLDWAEEKTHTDINYMFLIPLQKLNIISQNMKKLSFMELLQRCFEIRENLTFWDSEKIMFILDGLNEFKLPLDIEKTKKIVDVNESASVPDLLTNLIKRNLLPKSLIWITSRPGAAGQIPERYVNRVTQLNGFNEGQKEEYFQRSIGDKSTANRVINHIKTSKRIHSMCHIPDYCRILATMSEMMFKTDRAKIPETLTQMYATFLIAQTKMNRDSSHFLGKETIISLGKLAFQLLVHDRYLLRLEDLKKSGISAESITSNSAIIKMIKDFPNKSKSFCFVNHRTQEFMAALYVTEMINRGHNREHTDPLQEFSSLKLNPLYGEQCFTESRLLQDVVDMTLERQMDVFLSFLLGLSLESSRRILQGILTRRESSSSSIQAITQHIKSMIQISPEKSSRLFDCLIELDETLFVQDIKTKLKYEVRLSPSDWSDRMFLLLNSEEHQDPTMHKTTAESSSRWNYQKSDKMEKQQSEEQNKRHQPCSTRSHSSVSTLYQERLKQRMKEELQYLNEDTLFGKRPLLKDIFIERKMREESISNPADDKEIPISNIFEGENIQPVLTKGDAGFGKTVCVQKFVLDWAEEKTHTDINYMFLIPLQKLNIISQNMKKLSFMELLQRCFEIRENLTFWDSEKIMFILDGLNEFKLPLDIEKTKKIVDVNESASVPDLLTNLIKRNLLPKSLIWITSRPGAAGQIPERYVNRVTQLNGFNEGQKEEYFQRSIGDKSTANRVINHIKTSKRIHSMCHIPDYCRILATMSEMMFKTDRAKIPETLTQMYATFLIAQTKMNRDSSHFLGKETIISLGKLAFQLLVHDRYLLRLEDLKKSGISAESITSNSAIIKMIKDFPNKSKSFCFVNHRTQEFMAALFVTETINRGHNREHTDPLQEFSSLKLDPSYGEQCFTGLHLLQNVVDMTLKRQMDVFLSFLLGLSLESSRRILQGILTQRGSRSRSKQAITQHIKAMTKISLPEKGSRLIDCLIELDETLFVQEIKTQLIPSSRVEWSAPMLVFLSTEEHLDDSHQLEKRMPAPMLKTSGEHEVYQCAIGVEGCSDLSSVLSSNPSHLRKFDLNRIYLGDSEVFRLSALLKDPQCKLEKLWLRSCNITEEGCSALSSALRSNSEKINLKELDLSYNDIRDSGAKQLSFLLEDPQCELEKLWLKLCHIGERGSAFLLSALASNPTHLKELDLSENSLHYSGIQDLSIFLSISSCRLVKLKLRSCNINYEGCAALSSALTNPSHLRELDLSYNDLEYSAVKHLSAALENPLCKLEKLWLKSCTIPMEGFVALRFNSHLRELDMSDNNLGCMGVKHLSAALKHPPCNLEKLWLRSCNIFDTSCTDLSSALRSNPSCLRELDLRGNVLSDSGMKHLSALLEDPHCNLERLCFTELKESAHLSSALTSNSSHLRELDLSYNDISDSGVKEISALLEEPQCKLQKLILQSCNIAEGGCYDLSSALKSNRSHLTELDMSGNPIGYSGLKHLSALIKVSQCKLEKLWLRSCYINKEGCAALSSALRSNPSHLRELDLSYNEIRDSGLDQLSAFLKDPQCKLEKLWLRSCCIWMYSAALRFNSNLRELDLSDNSLSYFGVRELSAVLKDSQCKLEKLWMRHSSIHERGCAELSFAVKLNPSHLRELDLSYNNIGDLGVKHISALLQEPQCKLEKLWLRSCNIKEVGCAHLSAALTSCSSHLRELDISYNAIGDSEVNHLSALLDSNHCKLDTLWVKSCCYKHKYNNVLISPKTRIHLRSPTTLNESKGIDTLLRGLSLNQ